MSAALAGASGSGLLDDILRKLEAMPAAQRAQVEREALAATKALKWVPNPGPQTVAYNCDADQVFFGGEVAGGKTDLLIGRALNRHRVSLILRRLSKEVSFLVDRTQAILGGERDGFNGQDKIWRMSEGRSIQYGGCQNSGDEAGYKGKRKDFIGIDEASEFLESQIDFLAGWIGTADPKQPCQLLLASNPPRTMSGRWLLRWFAPWLDRTHARYPAQDGKLLWCMPIPGTDPTMFEWRDECWTIERDGKTVRALSRTFIRSALRDNPDYAHSGYGERIGNMSETNRRIYQMGDFTAGLEDHPDQLIPTEWVIAAQNRWKPDGGKHEPMTAMALDPAGGGRDDAVVACRHGGWYAALITANGPETADGSSTAAMVTRHRRNGCPVVVDVGGGYGGGVILRFKDNELPYLPFNGANGSTRRTRDRQLGFMNKRAEVWWAFKEELDPDQEGGSVIALPLDPELLADLTAPRYEVRAKGIVLEPKDDIRERLGRSPGRGDAVVMACSEGDRAVRHALARNGVFYSNEEQARGDHATHKGGASRPKVVLGRNAARRNAGRA